MEKKKNNLDFTNIIANVERVRQAKAAKEKKPSTSVKPLKFEVSQEDSPLKAAIVERINAQDMTYADIYKYCTNLKGGDIAEGQKLGYNTISGLKNRHTMIDTTFSMLCDFLEIDVMLVDRKKEEKEGGE